MARFVGGLSFAPFRLTRLVRWDGCGRCRFLVYFSPSSLRFALFFFFFFFFRRCGGDCSSCLFVFCLFLFVSRVTLVSPSVLNSAREDGDVLGSRPVVCFFFFWFAVVLCSAKRKDPPFFKFSERYNIVECFRPVLFIFIACCIRYKQRYIAGYILVIESDWLASYIFRFSGAGLRGRVFLMRPHPVSHDRPSFGWVGFGLLS